MKTVFILDTWIDAPDDLAHPLITVELISYGAETIINGGYVVTVCRKGDDLMRRTTHRTYGEAKLHMRRVINRYKERQQTLW